MVGGSERRASCTRGDAPRSGDGAVRRHCRPTRGAAAQLVELFQYRIEADGIARLDGPEHGNFQQDFLGRNVAQAKFRIGQHFENSRKSCGISQTGLFLERRDFGF